MGVNIRCKVSSGECGIVMMGGGRDSVVKDWRSLGVAGVRVAEHGGSWDGVECRGEVHLDEQECLLRL